MTTRRPANGSIRYVAPGRRAGRRKGRAGACRETITENGGSRNGGDFEVVADECAPCLLVGSSRCQGSERGCTRHRPAADSDRISLHQDQPRRGACSRLRQPGHLRPHLQRRRPLGRERDAVLRNDPAPGRRCVFRYRLEYRGDRTRYGAGHLRPEGVRV